jgi:hypothetical protein
MRLTTCTSTCAKRNDNVPAVAGHRGGRDLDKLPKPTHAYRPTSPQTRCSAERKPQGIKGNGVRGLGRPTRRAGVGQRAILSVAFALFCV